MADYPSTLPLPEGSDYRFEFGSMILRSDMDDGFPRQRRRFTSHVDSFPLFIYVDDAGLAEWERFVKDDINGGASWFNMPLRDSQGVRTMEVMLTDGAYTVQKVGMKWKISFTLDVSNRN